MGSLLTLCVVYMKKVVAAMEKEGADAAAVKKFQSSAQAYYTKVIAPNFKDFDFYVGESMDTDGMYVFQILLVCSSSIANQYIGWSY
jgi:hypothetical protein